MHYKLLILCSLLLIGLYPMAQNPNETTAVGQGLQVLSQDIHTPVSCFQKLEIGVPLPTEIREKVENFIAGTGGPQKQLNPYLEWELRVFAEFVNENDPSAVIVIDGFYTREFSPWSLDRLPVPKNRDSYDHREYANIGGYEVKKNLNDFRVRFAPPGPGNWSVIVKIAEKEEVVHTFPTLQFTAVTSNNSGYIHVSSNQRFLSKGDKTFYPLGCNLSWPETDSIWDPDLYNNLCYTDKGSKIYYRSNEGYRANYAAPRVYDSYRKAMSALAENGANYLRTIMYPPATDIEWEEVGNYTDRLAMAQEMDEILNLAEEKGLYLHWNMQIHYSFQFSDKAYYRQWAWDSKMNGTEFGYKKLLKSENPVDFFQNEDAKKYYKQRLRYILSRWGYSTHIAVWELFSEITNVGSPKADNNEFYMQGDNYLIYKNWQIEMANYLKSHYYGKVHLVTTSYGGPKHWKDDTFHNPAFDVMTSNIYDFEAPDFAAFWNNSALKHYLHDVPDTKEFYESYTTNADKFGTDNYQIRKPMFYTETDPIDAMCDSGIVEIRRSMWQGLFSGLAGTLSWDFRFHPQYYSMYEDMRSSLDLLDLNQEGWHPGAIEYNEGNWVFSSSNSLKMNPKKRFKGMNEPKTSLADVVYLRSKDKNFAIGLISNKTYNIKTVSNCYSNGAWPSDYESLNQMQTVSLKTDGPMLSGMNSGKYNFQYFLVSNPGKPIANSTDRGPELKMDYTMPADDANYLVLFIAYKKNHDWKQKRKLTKEEIKQMRSK